MFNPPSFISQPGSPNIPRGTDVTGIGSGFSSFTNLTNSTNPTNLTKPTTSTIDTILEKVTNIESTSNRNWINQKLCDSLREFSKREALLRESTITLKLDTNNNAEYLKNLVEKDWMPREGAVAATFWQDKEYLYAQFSDPSSKARFLEGLSSSETDIINQDNNPDKTDKTNKNGRKTLLKHLVPARTNGLHFQRNLIRCEIQNTRACVDEKEILKTIKALVGVHGVVENFKVGKPHQKTHARSILFQIDANAYKQLFARYDGAIPYSKDKTRMKLYPKIVCRPFQCRDCFKFGKHECQGKLCANCGRKGHQNNGCTRLRYCNNCKRNGHKAKELCCPTYLNQVIKEIRKADFPAKQLDFERFRLDLIRNMIIN